MEIHFWYEELSIEDVVFLMSNTDYKMDRSNAASATPFLQILRYPK